MNKQSKWYNPNWKDYYCNECGVLYQFYVNGLCSDCREPERVKMDLKLVSHFEVKKRENIEFKRNYKTKK